MVRDLRVCRCVCVVWVKKRVLGVVVTCMCVSGCNGDVRFSCVCCVRMCVLCVLRAPPRVIVWQRRAVRPSVRSDRAPAIRFEAVADGH